MLPLVRLALLALPFRLVTRALRGSARRAVTATRSPERISWAVRAAARHVPFAHNCLAHALAACLLLRRDGHRAALRVGVRRDARGQLMAHAWVESDGTVLVGAPEHQGYVPLPVWEASA